MIGGGLALTSIAGCQERPASAESEDEVAENGYLIFRDALAVVSDPWRLTAEEVTEDMIDAIVGELDGLAKAAIKGKSTSALKAIINATITSFEQLYQGQRIFEVEMMRAEAKEAIAGNPDLKSSYPDGNSYDSSKPYYPLFIALASAYNDVGEDESEANLEALRETAKTVEYVFVNGYISRVNQHIPAGGPSAADVITGDEPLAYSLKFLYESAQWTRENI